jgi:hypothetical protein
VHELIGGFVRPKRPVVTVFLHCSASDAIGKAYEGDGLVRTINSWHVARQFKDIGYHFVVDKSGVVLKGRSLERTPAAQAGHNTGSIAICAHGLKNFPPAQLAAVKKLCEEINRAYGGRISFHGHREVANKLCPVYAYAELLDLTGTGHMAVQLIASERGKYVEVV